MIGQELHRGVADFVADRLSLDDLLGWRRLHYQDLADLDDAQAAELYLVLEAVLAEHSIGTRSAASLRARLVEALNSIYPPGLDAQPVAGSLGRAT